jgi:DNA-binding SARP family transcriptional activator
MAVLLARANQTVTVSQLISETWGDDPPRRAVDALYVYVSQLRKLLHRSDCAAPIVTRSRGYMLEVEPGELDADDFTVLVEQGKRFLYSGCYESATRALRSAIGLWRGSAFGQSESAVISAYATLLDEARLECTELLMESELQCGRHGRIIGELRALITQHPLREKLPQQLMLALYRSDRRADALEVYRVARQRLNNEVGIDPCRALQDLHQSILHDSGVALQLAHGGGAGLRAPLVPERG